MNKICLKCGYMKPYPEFHQDLKMRDGYKNYCKQCTNVYNNSNKNISVKKRTSWLKIKHKMTMEQYEAMIAAQDNRCAVCFLLSPTGKFIIDRCPEKDVVWGLLCNSCKTGIALFKRRSYTLQNAINYLLKSKERDE